MESHPILSRALRAYFRRNDFPIIKDQPSTRACEVRSFEGFDYAVLRNSNRVLAVYRVKRDRLRRVTMWPREFEDW